MTSKSPPLFFAARLAGLVSYKPPANYTLKSHHGCEAAPTKKKRVVFTLLSRPRSRPRRLCTYHEGTGCTRTHAAVSTSRIRPARRTVSCSRIGRRANGSKALTPPPPLARQPPRVDAEPLRHARTAPGREELLLEDALPTARPLRQFEYNLRPALCLYASHPL